MGSTKTTEEQQALPVPRPDWALFLDIDGTLIDLAPTPEAIVIPASLAPTIQSVQHFLGGAVAAVSGRTMAEIDNVFAPLKLPCAGEHGSTIRLADGSIKTASKECKFPHEIYLKACAITKHWSGVLVEEKTYGICLHYRQAPDYSDRVRALAEELLGDLPGFSVLRANMALELRHHDLNKGSALEFFMTTPTFKGRTPVFIGDDVTDEDGFRAAEKAGGYGLHVNTCFAGAPANVRAWLQTFEH